jgi:hypothetical protein
LNSILQKKSTGVDRHYLDIWLPMHNDDDASVEKLVSNNIKCYRYLLYIRTYSLNILQERYTQELRKIHGVELDDPRSMPLNLDAVYIAGGGTPHGRYVKISIVFR